jgi:purine-binding chemotaxis protein CheW
MKEIMIFNLVNSIYGIELKRIKGILVYSSLIITPLYNEREWIIGVTNLRGEVIVVVDLRKRFGNKAIYNKNTVVIVIQTNEEKIIGVVVDSIEKIAKITNDNIISAPEISVGMDLKYIEGLVQVDENEMVTIINVDMLLSIEELS